MSCQLLWCGFRCYDEYTKRDYTKHVELVLLTVVFISFLDYPWYVFPWVEVSIDNNFSISQIRVKVA